MNREDRSPGPSFLEVSWVRNPIDPASAVKPASGYVRLATWEVSGDAIYFQWHAESGELNLVLRTESPRPIATMLKDESHFNVLIPIARWDQLLLRWGIGVQDLTERAALLREAAEILEV